MKEVIEWFTKAKLLILGVILMIPSFVTTGRIYSQMYDLYSWYGKFSEIYELLYYPALILSTFSLIFLFIKSARAFTAWKYSLAIFLVIYIIVLSQVPWFDHDQFFHLISKSNVAKVLAFFYSIFSLIFITVLALKDRKSKTLKR